MKKLDRILVPVDFSKYSDKAVEFALFAAKNNNARITLVHTLVMFQEESDAGSRFKAYEELVKQKEQDTYRLLQLHNEEAQKNGVVIDSELLRGFSAADTILDYISDNDFDLVIMGTHGRTGVKRWMYGGVAEKVVRHSPIPVLTTHHALKKFACEKILVPIDFSKYSKEAAEDAVLLAEIFKSQITFLHVIEQGIHPAFYAANIKSIFSLDPGLRERSIQKLEEFTGLSGKDFHYVVTEGIAHKEITEYAKDQEIDLIVMGNRGLTGLTHLLLGSTTERVVRSAPCAVLTTH